jgi:hypothetical protein
LRALEYRGFSGGKARSQGLAVRLVLPLPLLIVALRAVPEVPPKKNVLIINEADLSHSLTTTITQEILDSVRDTRDVHVEFYSESLDVFSSPERPSPAEIKDWLLKKYGDYNLDVVVAVEPDAIDFLSKNAQTLFPGVPIVICGSSIQQAGYPRLDARFSGTWMSYEPAKTIEVALRIFPKTRHAVVVGGASAYDRIAISLTKADLASLASKLDFIYLTDLEMNQLLERLHRLPEDSVVLYLSLFEDAAGRKFVNGTKVLPMVAEATNVPVFGVLDTYLGHGIEPGGSAYCDESELRYVRLERAATLAHPRARFSFGKYHRVSRRDVLGTHPLGVDGFSYNYLGPFRSCRLPPKQPETTGSREGEPAAARRYADHGSRAGADAARLGTA